MVDEDRLVGSHIHEIDNNSKIIGARVISESKTNKFLKSFKPFNHPSVYTLNVEAKKVGGYKNCYMFEDWFL